jgi:rod shape-determining protein MreD
LAVIYISFKAQGLQGQFTGFFSGLLQDGVSAAPLGLSAFINTLMATIFNSLSGRFYIDRILDANVFRFICHHHEGTYAHGTFMDFQRENPCI